MTDEPEIIKEICGQVAVITLNRPTALNALTHEMAVILHNWLREIENDEAIRCVVVQAAGDRAFCAGGDIVKLYEEGKAGGQYPYDFYRDEYRLNSDIFHYSKPYIALMDGIVMGGGVGVSVHGSHRVATERTMFAMPETGIGLFPDVGGAYFLSRLPNFIGLYLALTGDRIKAPDAVYAGVSDCYVPSEKLGDLVSALSNAEFGEQTFAATSQIIENFAGDAGEATLPYLSGTIKNYFGKNSLDEILHGLEAAKKDAWAQAVAVKMRQKSPTSMRLAFRQLTSGANMDFNACMAMEYRLACGCIEGKDFYEGVRAQVIDKDQNPVWQPANLDDCADADVAGYFDQPASAGDLTFDRTRPMDFIRWRMSEQQK